MTGLRFPTLEAPQVPNTARLACLLNQTHLIRTLSLLAETPRTESSVSEKGNMQNVQFWGASRTSVGNHLHREHS